MKRLRQITNAFSEDGRRILSVEQYLSLPLPDETTSGKKNPLFMHSGMSRFYFALTDKEQIINDKNAYVTANLPAEQVDALVIKTEALMALEIAGHSRKHTLYKSGYRYTSRLDKEGRNVCYSLTCQYNGCSEVHIKICNFVAPLVGEKGLKTIVTEKADCILNCDIRLTLDEWYRIIKRMADTKANFENLKFPSMFEYVEEHVTA